METTRFRAITQLTDQQCDQLMAVVLACATEDDDGCLLVNVDRSTRLSANAKDYVQIKIPVDPKHPLAEYRQAATCTNKKVQLHQLVMWTATLDGEHLFRPAIKEAELEISHLCSQKNCANSQHMWPETSSVNKSRNYCEVVIEVNGTLRNVCRHMPRCVATKSKKDNVLRFRA
jgi:hypothetical protein